MIYRETYINKGMGKAKKQKKKYKNLYIDVVYTFSYTTDLDYVTLEMKSIGAR
jgi:hypothetical protein